MISAVAPSAIARAMTSRTWTEASSTEPRHAAPSRCPIADLVELIDSEPMALPNKRTRGMEGLGQGDWKMTAMLGAFRENAETRAEFMELIRSRGGLVL